MGYRLFVVLFATIVIGVGSCFFCCVSGCAAFDSDNEPYVGWDPDIVPVVPGGKAGVHSGFYDGTLTLDSNSCMELAEEVGTVTDFSVDVIHIDNYLNLTFNDGSVAAGELLGDGAVFMQKDGSVENVYYFTFSDEEEAINGSLELIEPNESDQYGDPCAVYTVTLEEGEKPENFGTGEISSEEFEDESGEGDAEEDAEEDAPDEIEGEHPWNTSGI